MDDGSIVRVQSSDSSQRFPHDLIHFIVESELHLEWGFWGRVSKGAAFDSVTVVRPGRGRRPLRLSEQDIKRHNDEIVEAEALVGTMDRVWTSGVALRPEAMQHEFGNTWHTGRGLPLSFEEARKVIDALTATKAEWETVATNQALTRSW